jgi:hypothetical protein
MAAVDRPGGLSYIASRNQWVAANSRRGLKMRKAGGSPFRHQTGNPRTRSGNRAAPVARRYDKAFFQPYGWPSTLSRGEILSAESAASRGRTQRRDPLVAARIPTRGRPQPNDSGNGRGNRDFRSRIREEAESIGAEYTQDAGRAWIGPGGPRPVYCSIMARTEARSHECERGTHECVRHAIGTGRYTYRQLRKAG